MRRFENGGSNILGVSSVADQRDFVLPKVSEFEEVAPSDVGSVHEETGEIVKSFEIVENNNEDWDPEGIMMGEEFESSRLSGKMRNLKEKCDFTSVHVSADMMAGCRRPG